MLFHKQQGFSLLEILIAFTILAMSLSILLKIFATGVNSAILSEEYNAAVQIAESLIAKANVEAKPHNNRTTGVEDDKYHWEVSVSPFKFVAGKFTLKSTAELYKIEVQVNWGDDDENNRQLRLTTLRLVNKEQ